MKHKILKRTLKITGLVLLVLAAYVVGLFGLGGKIFTANNWHQTNRPVPTILIPGYAGNSTSTDMLISRLTRDGYGYRSLKAYVKSNGQVEYSGSWYRDEKDPLVQVVFQNNTEPDYHKTASWIGEILSHLHRTYGVKQYNAIAHSYGNNALVYYMAKHRESPRPARIVTVASSVDAEKSEILAYHRGRAGKMARYLKENIDDENWYSGSHSPFQGQKFDVLNIYGTFGSQNGDTSVSHAAARGMRKVFAGVNGTYQEKEFDGLRAQHSALVRSNSGVADSIAGFLKTESNETNS